MSARVSERGREGERKEGEVVMESEAVCCLSLTVSLSFVCL